MCETRDVKGFYRRARAGEIPFYTGISSPYEESEKPELVIQSDANLEGSIEKTFNFIQKKVKLESHIVHEKN